jgi:hypothetical protein
MRTTVDLDDDLLATVRAMARTEGRSIGRVLSDLARRGLVPAVSRVGEKEGFPVFEVGPEAPPITDEMVQSALEDSP